MERNFEGEQAWFEFADWSRWAGRAWASKMNSMPEMQPYLNPEGYLELSEGYKSIPLGGDGSSTIVPYTPKTEPITGFDMVPAQDPAYWEIALEEQRTELKNQLGRKPYWKPDIPKWNKRVKELRALIKESEQGLATANLAAIRQEKISEVRRASPELNALASGIERDTREVFARKYEAEALRQTQLVKEGKDPADFSIKPNYTPEDAARVAELQAKEAADFKKTGSIWQRLVKWNEEMKALGLDPKKWGGTKGGYLLGMGGNVAMNTSPGFDVHRYMKGGFDINTGQTYYPSELTEIDGVHIPNERIDELMRYHPKNAAKYPEITDNQRYKVHPAWFDEDPAITKKKADEKFKKETGAKGPVPMTTPTPSVSINIDTNSDIGAFLFS